VAEHSTHIVGQISAGRNGNEGRQE